MRSGARGVLLKSNLPSIALYVDMFGLCSDFCKRSRVSYTCSKKSSHNYNEQEIFIVARALMKYSLKVCMARLPALTQ